MVDLSESSLNYVKTNFKEPLFHRTSRDLILCRALNCEYQYLESLVKQIKDQYNNIVFGKINENQYIYMYLMILQFHFVI